MVDQQGLRSWILRNNECVFSVYVSQNPSVTAKKHSPNVFLNAAFESLCIDIQANKKGRRKTYPFYLVDYNTKVPNNLINIGLDENQALFFTLYYLSYLPSARVYFSTGVADVNREKILLWTLNTRKNEQYFFFFLLTSVFWFLRGRHINSTCAFLTLPKGKK